MRIFFDISTLSRWTGHAVGIVRVERELARHARECLSEDVQFCVYDLASGTFQHLKETVAHGILDETLIIEDQSQEQPSSFPKRFISSAKRVVGTMLLRSPEAFAAVQRARGHKITASQVRDCQRRTFGVAKPRALPLVEAAHGPISLTSEVVIISGGLDWDHKDIVRIREAKGVAMFKYFAIVHDLTPVLFPQYVHPRWVQRLTEYFDNLVFTADAVLCISETTRADYRAYFSQRSKDQCQSVVFELGADLAGHVEGHCELPLEVRGMRFALYVSTIEPRKNHRVLYDAWCHGIESGSIDPAQHRLVFVGREGWEVSDLLSQIARNPALGGSIVILSSVSDAALNNLYEGAAFTVFPSFYEGYGLSLAESLAHGKVCVTSGRGSLREIGSGLRIDIDPRDTIGWSREISRLLRNPAETQTREAEISQTFIPTPWHTSAEQFFGHVKSILGSFE